MNGAAQAVHTVGINWDTVLITVGTLGAFLLGVMVWVVGLNDKRNKVTRDEITHAVNNLSDVLQAKLETKDSVNALRIEVAQLRGQLSAFREEAHHA